MEMQRPDSWTEQEGEGGTNGEGNMEIYMLPQVKQPAGICCMTQGAHTSALRQSREVGRVGRRKGGSRGRGHMYTYD